MTPPLQVQEQILVNGTNKLNFINATIAIIGIL